MIQRISIFILVLISSVSWADGIADVFAKTASSPTSGSSDQDTECTPLKDGQSRTVNEEMDRSVTGAPRKYRITGTADPKVVKLELNLKFFPQARSEDYSKLAQNCFNQYKDKLVDQSGMRLEVNVVNDSKVPSNNISISVEPAAEPNAGAWRTAKMDCNRVIHESLHLTGLVDSYQSDKYDCRATESKTRSIMTAGANVLEDHLEALNCSCNENSCINEPTTTKTGSACPPGYISAGRFQALPVARVKDWDQRMRSETPAGAVLMTRPASNRTPLTKAQMMTITQPYCKRDSTYMRCAKYALSSSSAPGGCPDMPSMCKDGSWTE